LELENCLAMLLRRDWRQARKTGPVHIMVRKKPVIFGTGCRFNC
jgi:hypothetical protein